VATVLKRLPPGLIAAALAGAVCVAGASPTSQIVGGGVIQIQAAPWTVFVQQQAGSTRFLCTGSVVDASHILTAAHCVYDDNGNLATPAQITIKAGVSNFSASSPTDVEQDRTVTEIRVHPGYTWSAKPVPDDVAVLTLPSPLDLSNPATQAIALPAPGSTFPAGVAIGVAGFGRQTPTVQTSGPLSWMTGTTDPQGDCGTAADQGLIDSNAILVCASSPTSAVCNGDSGSGLVTTTTPPILVGVTSAGGIGCDVGSRGVFTYTGAPEILSFIQGNDHPPTAPRVTDSTTLDVTWDPPLVAGTTLTCTSGGWPAGTTLAYSFVDTASNQVLASGPHSTFRIPPADVGATVDCEIAVSNAGGTTLEETQATSKVKAAPQVRIESIAPVTAVRGKDVTIAVTLRSPAGLFGKFGVCVVPAKPIGGRVCSSVHNDHGVAGAFPFHLRFKVKQTSPLVTTHVEVDAVAGLSSARAKALVHVTRG
jgi:hypothetical protein